MVQTDEILSRFQEYFKIDRLKMSDDLIDTLNVSSNDLESFYHSVKDEWPIGEVYRDFMNAETVYQLVAVVAKASAV